jgi:hypothetical protein
MGSTTTWAMPVAASWPPCCAKYASRSAELKLMPDWRCEPLSK